MLTRKKQEYEFGLSLSELLVSALDIQGKSKKVVPATSIQFKTPD